MQRFSRSILRTLGSILLSAFYASTITIFSEQATLAEAPSPNHYVKIWADRSEKNTVKFFIQIERTLETSVIFNCNDLKNLMPDHALPYSFVVRQADTPIEFLTLRQAVSHHAWSYGDWDFHSKIGASSAIPTTDYAYAFPYPSDKHYTVIQSFLGKFSHFEGSGSEYAVDFDLPEGSTVCAARSGVVVGLRDDSEVGGDSQKFKNSDNYVIIKHEDGTYGSYAHFKHNGVLVKLGQKIAEGDQIGLSGATGWADRPHLHFAVFRVSDAEHSQSIPFQFKIGKVLIKRPIRGQLY